MLLLANISGYLPWTQVSYGPHLFDYLDCLQKARLTAPSRPTSLFSCFLILRPRIRDSTFLLDAINCRPAAHLDPNVALQPPPPGNFGDRLDTVWTVRIINGSFLLATKVESSRELLQVTRFTSQPNLL